MNENSTDNILTPTMDTTILNQPNGHGDLYRNLPPVLDIIQMDQYLDFIDVNSEGYVLLGSSNLTGRVWNGAIWLYSQWPTHLDNYFCNKAMASGISDGKFLKDGTRMFVVDDSGGIQLISTQVGTGASDEEALPTITLAEEHEAAITEISISSNERHFLTSSMDCSIKLWDIERMRVESSDYFEAVNTYSNAHKDVVTSVAAHTTQNAIFSSCSMDRDTLLWDIRLENPASLIYQNDFCSLTRTVWHPSRDNLCVVSSDKGDIYMIDIREPKQFLSKAEHFNRSIYRMKFNESGLLAVCADNNLITVLDVLNKFAIVYKNESHTDMVRGLAWVDETYLISCGWDKTVQNHHLKPTETISLL